MRTDFAGFVSLGFLREMPRWALLGAAFAAGFCVVAAAINLSLPPAFLRHDLERSEKLALIDRWQERATSAAFGTSRVHNGFVPTAFDAEFADAPYAVTSLNLGLFGGSQTEQRALAREFLAHLDVPKGRPSVCLVMLELNAGLNFQLINLLHPRSIDVYDLDTVRFVASFSDQTIDWTQRVGRLGFALISGALHFANIGMLSSAWFGPSAHSSGGSVADERGQLVVPTDEDGARGVTAAFQGRVDRPQTFRPKLVHGNETLVEDLASVSRTTNVQFLYFVLPTLDALTRVPLYPATLSGPRGPVPIINLAQPDRYPQLFKPEAWGNPGHLSALGATLASRTLAHEVRAWLASQPTVPRCGE